MPGRRLTARSYLFAWIALVVLSLLTLGLSFAPLGAFHVPVALLIAAAKGALIIAIFMHLAEQSSVQRVVLIFWLLLLAILIVLTAADVATRRVSQRPPISAFRDCDVHLLPPAHRAPDGRGPVVG